MAPTLDLAHQVLAIVAMLGGAIYWLCDKPERAGAFFALAACNLLMAAP